MYFNHLKINIVLYFLKRLKLMIKATQSVSPEPKAQVSFSDQNLSDVRRGCRRRCSCV